MREPTEAELTAAAQSLYRIRAAESPPDAEGFKSVWHQGAQGADLLSFVSPAGHVTRQEFTLFGDYFLWTSRHGLRTGGVDASRAVMRAEAAAAVQLEATLQLPRVERAHRALTRYDGMDRYILHLQHVLERVLAGQQDHEEPTITRPSGEVRAVLPGPWPWLRRRAAWIVAGLVGLGVALGLVLLRR